MRPGRSGLYRRQDGSERLWLAPADIETMMEEELHRLRAFPTEAKPAVDIERFVQGLGARMDQHAELDDAVLGLTEFYEDGPPRILINRDLTGAIDDDETPPGIRGRWRATVAHECSHVVMHRVLFELNRGQAGLFRVEEQAEPRRLMRCMKKDVLFRSGAARDWREVQANMGMAALLMPSSLFRKMACQLIELRRLSAEDLRAGSAAAATLTAEMSTLFDVSKQAAGIRLDTLGLVASARQPWLI
jgi:hypothetical protein